MESFPVIVCIPFPFITQDPEIGLLFANPPVARAYQWYNDSIPIPGENLNVFIPDADGLFKVEVTDFDNCVSISEGFRVEKITGLGIEHSGISIYPNPVVDELYLQLGTNEKGKAILYDLNGQRLFESLFEGSGNIDMQKLASGIYVVQLLIGDESVSFKVRKN